MRQAEERADDTPFVPEFSTECLRFLQERPRFLGLPPRDPRQVEEALDDDLTIPRPPAERQSFPGEALGPLDIPARQGAACQVAELMADPPRVSHFPLEGNALFQDRDPRRVFG